MKKPRLDRIKCERRGEKWSQYHCSECMKQLDKTAKYCVWCGAWFKKRKKK